MLRLKWVAAQRVNRRAAARCGNAAIEMGRGAVLNQPRESP